MNSIDEVAADWAARADGRPLSVDEKSALDTWLAADVRHLGAFARAQAVAIAYEDAVAKQVANDHRPPPALSSNRRWFIGGGLAAGLGAVSVAGIWMATADTAYATAKGESLTVPFGNGVGVTLNTDTRIRARQVGDQVRVRLERGEILADCTGGDLVVRCGEVLLVGAASVFTLKRDDTTATLTVESGRVDVMAGGTRRARLAAGDRASLSEDGLLGVEHLDQAGIERAVAWREGMIAFEDSTLEEAAAQFARYNSRPIVVEGAARSRRVSGLFAARDPEGFARSMGVISNLSVEIAPDRVTLSER